MVEYSAGRALAYNHTALGSTPVLHCGGTHLQSQYSGARAENQVSEVIPDCIESFRPASNRGNLKNKYVNTSEVDLTLGFCHFPSNQHLGADGTTRGSFGA